MWPARHSSRFLRYQDCILCIAATVAAVVTVSLVVLIVNKRANENYLIKNLKASNRLQRQRAVAELGEMRLVRSIPDLTALLRFHGEPSLETSAQTREIAIGKGLFSLSRAVDERKQDLRFHVICSLAMIGPPAIEYLTSVVPSWQAVERIAFILDASLSDETLCAMRNVIMVLSRDTSEEVRKTARMALERLKLLNFQPQQNPVGFYKAEPGPT